MRSDICVRVGWISSSVHLYPTHFIDICLWGYIGRLFNRSFDLPTRLVFILGIAV
jgi:hypothetical protein